MTPQSAKAKGKLLEQYVADRIIFHGLDDRAKRDGASGAGNREKADISTSLTILGTNAGIECKNHAKPDVGPWWRQAKKLIVLGREPVLVFKTFGEPLEETKALISLETFLELVKRANAFDGQMPSEGGDPAKKRDLRWAIQGLKSAASKVDKLLQSEG